MKAIGTNGNKEMSKKSTVMWRDRIEKKYCKKIGRKIVLCWWNKVE
jgi:hypothetical protein